MILTVGHSNHPIGNFLALLQRAGVTAVADVRSYPVSRYAPQFNKDALGEALSAHGIAYRYLGDALGGRPRDRAFYCDGVVDYDKLAASKDFQAGLDRVIEASAEHRVALLCTERDPLHCHRCLLVARRLAERGPDIGHVLASGEIASQRATEDRLLEMESLGADDLFSRASRLADAYRARRPRISSVAAE
jgi:uncharacterized protein (DUF488 family)